MKSLTYLNRNLEKFMIGISQKNLQNLKGGNVISPGYYHGYKEPVIGKTNFTKSM